MSTPPTPDGMSDGLEREREIRRHVHTRFKEARKQIADLRRELGHVKADRDYFRTLAETDREIYEIAGRLIEASPQPPPADHREIAVVGKLDSALLAQAVQGADWPGALAVIAEAEAGVDRLRVFFVHLARKDGMSWAQIGEALGVTGEAVRKRYHDAPDPWDVPEGSGPLKPLPESVPEPLPKEAERPEPRPYPPGTEFIDPSGWVSSKLTRQEIALGLPHVEDGQR